MSTLQQRLAAVTDTAANLKAQLRELNRLRDQVRKARGGNRLEIDPKIFDLFA
jgi:hypothetical protein